MEARLTGDRRPDGASQGTDMHRLTPSPAGATIVPYELRAGDHRCGEHGRGDRARRDATTGCCRRTRSSRPTCRPSGGSCFQRARHPRGRGQRRSGPRRAGDAAQRQAAADGRGAGGARAGDRPTTLVISIAAGISTAYIERHLGAGKPWRVDPDDAQHADARRRGDVGGRAAARTRPRTTWPTRGGSSSPPAA